MIRKILDFAGDISALIVLWLVSYMVWIALP